MIFRLGSCADSDFGESETPESKTGAQVRLSLRFDGGGEESFWWLDKIRKVGGLAKVAMEFVA
jgi:hypothetical protein